MAILFFVFVFAKYTRSMRWDVDPERSSWRGGWAGSPRGGQTGGRIDRPLPGGELGWRKWGRCRKAAERSGERRALWSCSKCPPGGIGWGPTPRTEQGRRASPACFQPHRCRFVVLGLLSTASEPKVIMAYERVFHRSVRLARIRPAPSSTRWVPSMRRPVPLPSAAASFLRVAGVFATGSDHTHRDAVP